MTVATQVITAGPYNGNGVTVNFSFPFRVDESSELSVYEKTDLGVETLLILNTDYTVAGIGVDAGGTVTRTAGALPTNYTWYIRANYAPTQATAFASQGGFYPDVHEYSMDKLTFLVQQLHDVAMNRSIRASVSDVDTTALSMIIPAVTDRVNKFLAFDALGNVSMTSFTPSSSSNAADVVNIPSGNIVATDVQSALNELDSEMTITVGGITELLGLSSAESNPVRVLGYVAPVYPSVKPFDGGGGVFLWDATRNKTDANFGTVFDPSVSLALQGTGVGTGCWVRNSTTELNTMMFGCVGDGVVDDLPALQRAVNYAGANSLPIKALAGTYLLNGTLKLYDPTGAVNYRINMTGEGWESPNADVAQGGTMFIHGSGYGGIAVDADYSALTTTWKVGKALTFKNIGVIGGDATLKVLSVTKHKRGLDISNTYLEANANITSGLWLQDSWYGDISTVRVYCNTVNAPASTGYGVRIYNQTGAGAANQYIFDNVNIRNFFNGYAIGGVGAGSARHSTISIRGGQVSSTKGVGFALKDACNLIKVERVNIELCNGASDIDCSAGTKIVFDNNHVYQCGDTATSTPAFNLINSANVVFRDNHFERNNYAAIAVAGGSNTKDTVIDNNSFTEDTNPSWSLAVLNPSSNVQFLIKGLLNDGTTNGVAGSLEHFDFDGSRPLIAPTTGGIGISIDVPYPASVVRISHAVATTVLDVTSSLHPIREGKPIRFRTGNNATTFKDVSTGGNFRLAGGVDFAMTNFSSLTVYKDGGVWYEECRSVN